MLKTIDKIKFKTDKIADLLDDVKKPMSLNEIMSKYDVSYPFTVKCVKEFYGKVTGKPWNMVGKVLTYYKDEPYIYNDALAMGNIGSESKDSKKFILWE